MTKKNEETQHLYLEARTKAVKRALRNIDHGLDVIEVRLSDPHTTTPTPTVEAPKIAGSVDEHGKTTVVYTSSLDAAALNLALNAISKQANIEQDWIDRDDDEEDA